MASLVTGKGHSRPRPPPATAIPDPLNIPLLLVTRLGGLALRLSSSGHRHPNAMCAPPVRRARCALMIGGRLIERRYPVDEDPQYQLTRIPVAVGEAKWARSVDGARIKARLIAKAPALTREVDRLTYVVCARSEVTRADADTIVITAADIFPDPGGH